MRGPEIESHVLAPAIVYPFDGAPPAPVAPSLGSEADVIGACASRRDGTAEAGEFASVSILRSCLSRGASASVVSFSFLVAVHVVHG